MAGRNRKFIHLFIVVANFDTFSVDANDFASERNVEVTLARIFYPHMVALFYRSRNKFKKNRKLCIPDNDEEEHFFYQIKHVYSFQFPCSYRTTLWNPVELLFSPVCKAICFRRSARRPFFRERLRKINKRRRNALSAKNERTFVNGAVSELSTGESTIFQRTTDEILSRHDIDSSIQA